MLVEIRRGGKLGWSVVKENFLLMILLGAGHSLTSGFENLALKRVSLSLTQMVKSSGPAVVMLFHWTRTGKSYTAKMKVFLLFCFFCFDVLFCNFCCCCFLVLFIA